ncbi:MAG TPA: class I SAM-dependent methyltransferase [Burkholderiales bacterium]
MNREGNGHRPCVVCSGATEIALYCTVGAIDYVQCRRCRLVYVDRLASDDAMRGAYSGGVIRKLRRRLMAPFRKLRHHKHFAQSMERARRIYAFAGSQVDRNGETIRFLDIGCNRGYLLAAAIERGAQVYGIELVREITLPFRNTYPELRDRIYSEKLSQVAPRLDSGSFDLITAIDVVEHFEDPVEDMRQIHRLLKVGGAAVLQTPDAGCEQAKATGAAWGALKPLEHLHLFNRENFAAFAKAIGFRAAETHEPFEHADGNFVVVLKK